MSDGTTVVNRPSVDALLDPDFGNREGDEDRKFREIMAKEISLDNQIMCQFATFETNKASFYTTCGNAHNRSRSNSEWAGKEPVSPL